MPEDKIKQEIEDILNQLDTFLPEDKKPIPFRRPRRSAAAAKSLRSMIEPLAQFSLRQLMLTALILLGVGFVAVRVDSVSMYGKWLLIAGVVLFLACFVLSIVNRRSAPAGPAYEKRWRGQPMDLDEPGITSKLRGWFRPKKR